MEAVIYIQNGDTVYVPVVEGNVSWEVQRKGQPGKLSFTVLADDRLQIEEGNAVRLDVDGKPAFFGFIFERSGSREKEVKITAYDQLRYFKNTDSYNYTNLTAGDLIAQIAADYNLRVGALEDTGYRIEVRNEKDKTLFDIILNALDITMMGTGKLFVLYDDAGALTLKNIENMKLNLMICDETAQDYDFKSSIDSHTYNQIELYRDDKETKKRELYVAKHTENVNKWGILRMHESISDSVNGQEAAEAYLSLYNKPSRSLKIKDAFGDISVRAGCLIPTFLKAGDQTLKNYMLVEAVTHKFSQGFHSMDLTLKGANFNG